MPNLFSVSGYLIYFWSNENNEPIHVHVSKGRPTKHATIFWLTGDHGCILATNGSKISNHDINKLSDVISAQYEYICEKWKLYFDTEKIKFYL
ncbi:DUF4160 domain-containing protein [Lactobacillus helveticus]|uniref:DUF4160 domain-containing protein n=1 Tax=Lactobacillus helveticus TaxID=1587 RepID=A0A8H9F8K8_LACHE|nr:DUF4160 domain-containing protein [Lactobacillus helveticus]MBW8061572.1 DUF4160 domain-containing protein [Lactobacillus helveticus]NRO05563.1 hypothetical protein [Lactobacillus helveticus]GFO99539.1 hypothetical protein LHEH8_12950 [Lactobacillus helveticus]GFP01352.1 hypothetical protein LHEW6_11850 [Lactobacillus helveticus]GFP02594.1 hypothetical protein LHEY10_05230 [Lactobacillus helveticus]